jgi:hypothetical protein
MDQKYLSYVSAERIGRPESSRTKYLCEVQMTPGDAKTLSDATSPHIDDSDETILRVLEELPVCTVRQLSRQYIYQMPWYTTDSMRNSGLLRVISDGSHISSRMIRRQHESHAQGPF